MTKSGTLVPKKKAKFSNFGSNRFLSRIEPFWVILRKKNVFEKIIEKWLSLEAWWPLWRKWKSKISKIGYFHELDHSEWFGAKKNFRKISTDHPIWPFLAVMAPRRKLYLLKTFFSGPEIFRECSSQYYLPFLRVSEKSNVKKLF